MGGVSLIKHDKNHGTLIARVELIKKAKGKYLLFIDPDDYISTNNCISRVVPFLSDNFDVIEFNKNYLSQDGAIVSDNSESLIIYTPSEILRACFIDEKIFWMLTSKFIKTEVAKESVNNLEIKDLPYLTCAEDAFISFLLFLRCRNYKRQSGINFYNYRTFSGVTAKKSLNARLFKEQYLLELIVPSLIKEYVEKNYPDSLDKIFMPLDYLRKRLFREQIRRSNNLSISERKASQDYLLKHKSALIYDFLFEKVPPTLKLLTVYHKPCEVIRTNVYTPILVGNAIRNRETKDGYFNENEFKNFEREVLKDDIGENVSDKNRSLNELTAIYWAWKNYDQLGNPAWFGLVHYRRFFIFDDSLPLPNELWLPGGSTYCFNKLSDISKYISEEKCLSLLKRYDCLITKKYNDRFFSPEKSTMRESYITHGKGELDPVLYDLMEKIVLKKYPKYRKHIDFFRNSSEHYFCNMFIFPKDLFFEYCEFLFSVIFEIDDNNINASCAEGLRAPGYIGEYLTSMFISQKIEEGRYRFKELNTLFINNTNDIRRSENKFNLVDLDVSDLKKLSSRKLAKAFVKSAFRASKNKLKTILEKKK